MEIKPHRFTYYQDEDILFEYEVAEGCILLHCIMHSWKPSILRRGYSIFAKFKQDCKDVGISTFRTLSPNPKFAHVFGGKTLTSFAYNGIEYEEVVWELLKEPLH